MKRYIFLSILLGTLPMLSMAQDDMYFTPSRSKESVQGTSMKNSSTYYSGIDKSTDEYNRRSTHYSSYQIVGKDSLGNEIIEFKNKDGVAKRDTIYGELIRQYNDDDDFAYSRRMSRFDGYYGYYSPSFVSSFYYGDPFFYNNWGWYSPFYYTGWYDPWYYRSFYGGYPYYWRSSYYYAGLGWGSPWYYDWGGYYGGYYGYRPFRGGYYTYRNSNGLTGTEFHGGGRRVYNNNNRVYSYKRDNITTYRRSNTVYNDNSDFQNRSYQQPRTFSQPNSSFGSATRGSSGSGSFGGQGSRSFGGGSFGGGGSRSFGGGGGHFGGHR